MSTLASIHEPSVPRSIGSCSAPRPEDAALRVIVKRLHTLDARFRRYQKLIARQPDSRMKEALHGQVQAQRAAVRRLYGTCFSLVVG